MKRFTGRPIFICGWPRGGTRMMANLVASHPHIIPSSEVPRPIMLSILELMEVADGVFEKKEKRREPWSMNRQDYFLNLIANTYGPKAIKVAEHRDRFLNKTPSAENLYKSIVGNCATEKPQFIYCVRHPKKVLRSLKNMPWNVHTLEENLIRLQKSAKIAEEMSKDNNLSIKIVQIDKVGETKEDRLSFTKNLFNYLEEDMAENVVKHVTKWALAQPVTDVLKDKKIIELDEKEMSEMDKSKKYKDLCSRFGYQA